MSSDNGISLADIAFVLSALIVAGYFLQLTPFGLSVPLVASLEAASTKALATLSDIISHVPLIGDIFASTSSIPILTVFSFFWLFYGSGGTTEIVHGSGSVSKRKGYLRLLAFVLVAAFLILNFGKTAGYMKIPSLRI